MEENEVKEIVERMIPTLQELARLNLPAEKAIAIGAAIIDNGTTQWRMHIIDSDKADDPPQVVKGEWVCFIGHAAPLADVWMIALFEFDNDNESDSQRLDFPLPLTPEQAAARIFDYIANGIITRSAPTQAMQ